LLKQFWLPVKPVLQVDLSLLYPRTQSDRKIALDQKRESSDLLISSWARSKLSLLLSCSKILPVAGLKISSAIPRRFTKCNIS